MSDNSGKSLFNDLWERRVPQFLATYVGVSWGIIQFMIFASNRYGLDSSYIDKFLLFVLILIPSVVVFTYNHGRPGHDNWKGYEKIMIPFNFLLAVGIASFAGNGNTVNAAPNEVQITTIEGDTITRMVPAISQTKTFALFPFENKTNNQDQDWMRLGIARLINTDLEQDIRLYCLSPYGFEYEYESRNYTLQDDIPFSAKLKMAKNKLAQYFITGDYIFDGDKVVSNIKVYEAKTGEEFFTKEYESDDIFQLADSFTKDLSDNLFLENSRADQLEVTDLPALDLITGNIDAFRKLINSEIESKIKNNQELALSYAQEAAELDPNSAEIKKLLAGNIYLTGDMRGAQKAMTEAVELSDNLSERQRLNLRAIYYIYHQETDKAIQLWEMWRTLYPKDYYPYTQLMEFYSLTRNFGKAKVVGLEAIESGHKDRVLKRMANVCMQRDELKEAEKYLLEYLDRFPDKAKNDTQLAELYQSQGELEKAQKYLEKIELLNPEDHSILNKLAEVFRKQGQYDKAERYYQKALTKADLPQDSISVLLQQMLFYVNSADRENFRKSAALRLELMRKSMPDIAVASQMLQYTGLYSQLGLLDEFTDFLDEVTAQAPQVKPTFDCVIDFIASLTKEDLDKFKDTYTAQCKNILLSGSPELDYLAQGLIAKMEGNYQDAIRFIEIYIDSTGGSGKEYGFMLAEAYRKAGNYDAAIQACADYLEMDLANPYFLINLAHAYLDKGEMQKAKESFEKLSSIWKNIDENSVFYNQYKELEDKLEDS